MSVLMSLDGLVGMLTQLLILGIKIATIFLFVRLIIFLNEAKLYFEKKIRDWFLVSSSLWIFIWGYNKEIIMYTVGNFGEVVGILSRILDLGMLFAAFVFIIIFTMFLKTAADYLNDRNKWGNFSAAY